MAPSLYWPTKTECVIAAFGPEAPLGQIASAQGSEEAPARLLHGDCLGAMHLLERQSTRFKLVYMDPPFASGVDYATKAKEGDPKLHAFTDKWESIDNYLSMLFPRLKRAYNVLEDDGTLWVHVDWRANYYVRNLCDEIFGSDGFLNEIVWKRAPNLGRQASSNQFGRNVDTIIVYGKPGAKLRPPKKITPTKGAKYDATEGKYFTLAPRGDYTDSSIARLEQENRVYRTPSGKVYIKYWLEKDENGEWGKPQPVDSVWTDIPALRHASPKERTGYPTQKPLALLDRILKSATEPGDLVLDPFCGSGSTVVQAVALGRRAVGIDIGELAIRVSTDRLANMTPAPCVRIERLHK